MTKYRTRIITCLALLLGLATTCLAMGSFSVTDKYAWSETSGWLNFSPDGSGVVVYPDHLEGYLWAENIGWIKLGSNSSGGNLSYANSAADNWGVNRSGTTLTGYAWSETSGWINFAPSSGGVTFDVNGSLGGYAWAENIGWIHLKNTNPAFAYGPVLAPPVTLTATVSGNGSVITNLGDGALSWNGSTGTASYLQGTILTLSGIPSQGSNFLAWGGDCSGSEPCTLTMAADHSISASFGEPGLVRINSTTYPTLNLAYAAAASGNILQIQALTFDENLQLDRNISIKLSGGLDSSFQPTSGYTTINGTVTLSGSGTVTVDRIIIK